METKAERQAKRFAARARRFAAQAKGILLIGNTSITRLATELGHNRTSVSLGIHHGGKLCPEVHRKVAKRLNLNPLI